MAGVDARAGWTESIFLFQATVGQTKLVLVDTPGYGVAIASEWTSKKWKRSIDNYLDSSTELRCMFLLVDCTRGLCELDWQLIRRAERRKISCQVVLTKADLLTQDDLARSHAVVTADLREHETIRHPQPTMVSANFVQGVKQLWSLARHHVLERSRPGRVGGGVLSKSRPDGVDGGGGGVGSDNDHEGEPDGGGGSGSGSDSDSGCGDSESDGIDEAASVAGTVAAASPRGYGLSRGH
jgi:GTP-binding protein EngB required for normal cell division